MGCQAIAARIALASLLMLCTAQTAPPPELPPPLYQRLDPLTVLDADFMRHRDPADWAGLDVAETRFTENGFGWHFFRITNRERPGGFFWAVLHDDENAAFSAALAGVRRHGGVAMIVSTTSDEEINGARYNRSLDGLRQIDPNRNFRAESPRFARTFLDVPEMDDRMVLSIHTNARGYDVSRSRCAQPGDSGSGTISVRFCDGLLQPFASIAQRFPFDDADTLVMVPLRLGTPFPKCSEALRKADFNVVAEQIWYSDGSLSNHLLRLYPKIRYVTLETAHERLGEAVARQRLDALAKGVIETCGG